MSVSEPGRSTSAAPSGGHSGGHSGRYSGRDLSQRRLLQSIVEVARSVFCAAAASVFLVDEDTGELVFEAVCGGPSLASS